MDLLYCRHPEAGSTCEYVWSDWAPDDSSVILNTVSSTTMRRSDCENATGI